MHTQTHTYYCYARATVILLEIMAPFLSRVGQSVGYHDSYVLKNTCRSNRLTKVRVRVLNTGLHSDLEVGGTEGQSHINMNSPSIK